MKKNVFISLIILMIFSIINTYYSKYYLSSFNNYYIKQLLWFLLGFIFIYLLSKVNLNYILNKSIYLYLFGVFLLIITLFIGKNVNGSKSWLSIFGLSFQPSEFMKVFIILFLYHVTKDYKISTIKYIIISFITILIPSILVLIEPDTGPIISYIVIFITFLILKKINKYYYISFISLFLILISIFFYLYFFKTNIFIKIFGTNFFYRFDRLTSFFKSEGYQMETSLKSISLSGYFGIKKRVYFPEAATDFAITLLIANFGLIGLLIYLLLDTFLILNIINLKKDKYIIYPVISVFIVQAIINMFMNVGLFPIIGITYPFLSYGGSSIISYFILIGIIYNMDYNIHHNNYNYNQ